MSERVGNSFMAAFGVAGAAFFFVLLQQGMPLEGKDVLFAFLYSGFSWFSVFFVMYSIYGTIKMWFQEIAERYYPSPTDDDTPPNGGNGAETGVSQPETGVSREFRWKRRDGEGESDYVERLRSYRTDETDDEYIAKLLGCFVPRRYIAQVIHGRRADVLIRIGKISEEVAYA